MKGKSLSPPPINLWLLQARAYHINGGRGPGESWSRGDCDSGRYHRAAECLSWRTPSSCAPCSGHPLRKCPRSEGRRRLREEKESLPVGHPAGPPRETAVEERTRHGGRQWTLLLFSPFGGEGLCSI